MMIDNTAPSEEPDMSFEDVMATMMRFATAAEALAAVGAELALAQSGESAPPEIVGALRAVSTAADVGDLGEIPPPQQAIMLSVIRMYLRQSADLLEEPSRAPGWTFTDPTILDGWGRGSTMVPALIAAAHPDLAQVESLLDVGTGVGLLAVAAANLWPNASVVGIDRWDPALDRAHANVEQARLRDRITLRHQALTDLDDIDTFDCAWIPTFFVTEADLERALPGVLRAMRPGGWIALGRRRTIPDPLAEATAVLRTIRGGGCEIDEKRAIELLEAVGCHDVHAAPSAGPAPLELVLGRRA
jgi:SAM-dependent methyltransferase